jgi:signal transduction histidine kinase
MRIRAPTRRRLRRRGSGGRRQRLLASRARFAGLISSLLAASITIGLLATGTHFAYRRPVLRAGLETAEALVALLIAYLVIGRLRRSRSLDDVVLVAALGTLAVGNLCFGAIPALVAEGQPAPVASWAGVGTRLIGALLFAAAAFVPRRPLENLARASADAFGGVALAVMLVVIGVSTMRSRLPSIAAPDEAKAAAARPEFFSHHWLFAIQLIGIILYMIAAVGFAKRADQRPDDSLLLWLGAGAVFAAYAWMNYFLAPALFYAHWVYTADVFRFLFYLMLLIGAVHEINGYWRRSARLAVVEERRRLARDLHDGLAQEVAYISRAAKLLRDGTRDVELLDRISSASERAARESRQVIAALTTPADEPLEAVLERVALDAAARHGAEVELDVARGMRLDPVRTEALLRITGEAVTNAARHSGVAQVRVVLDWRGGRPWLQVTDRGIGFDGASAAHAPGTFGLTSMRERAGAVGADFRLITQPGSGTHVEVAF